MVNNSNKENSWNIIAEIHSKPNKTIIIVIVIVVITAVIVILGGVGASFLCVAAVKLKKKQKSNNKSEFKSNEMTLHVLAGYNLPSVVFSSLQSSITEQR